MTEDIEATCSRVDYDRCPLCNSKKFGEFSRHDCRGHALYNDRIPNTIIWLKCEDCCHIYTSGYFSNDGLNIIFVKTHAVQQACNNIEAERFRAGRMVHRVARYVQDGAWLDIGVGNAALVFAADEYGYSIVGTDLRYDNVQTLKDLNFEAYHCDITDLIFKERFSVVSMADVLEHMPFPNKALKAAYDLTRSGGVLLISMPNMSSQAWRSADSSLSNPYWYEIEHYHNFTRERLYSLLKSHGFNPVEYGISERYRFCMEVLAIRV